MKRTKFGARSLLVILVLAVLSYACENTIPQASSPKSSIVYADPQLELLYQAALENNPQSTYSEEEYRSMFFDWYGGESSKLIYAKAFKEVESDTVFVQASGIVALKANSLNPETWLVALTVWTGVNAVIAMNAEMAANLNLPVIEINDTDKIVVPQTWTGLENAETIEADKIAIDSASWALQEYVPQPGISSKLINNKYTIYSHVISSLPNLCSLWFKATMPKADWSELLDFEQKFEDDKQCNVFTIITEMMKLGVKAAKAGVGIQFIREFYLQVFTEIVKDMGLPQPGSYIVDLLGW